ILRIGKGVRALAPLKPRNAGVLARRHAANEGLRGRVQPSEHVLEHLGLDGGIVREGGASLLEFRLLLRARDPAALAAAPPGEALLQGGGVEQATAPQYLLQRPFLGGWRAELLFVRLPQARCHLSASLVR